MNSLLLIAIGAGALLVVILLLIKLTSNKKEIQPPEFTTEQPTDAKTDSVPDVIGKPDSEKTEEHIQEESGQPIAEEYPIKEEETLTPVDLIEENEELVQDEIDQPIAEEDPIEEEPVQEEVDQLVTEEELVEEELILEPIDQIEEEEEQEPETIIQPPQPDISEHVTEAAASETVTVNFSIEEYAQRLNILEEKHRASVEEAIQQQNNDLREILQRELVVINEKLANLDNNYSAEIQRCEETLSALQEFKEHIASEQLNAALIALQAGQLEPAEEILTEAAKRPGANQSSAAFYGGQLAECRIDLFTALKRYRQALEHNPDNPEYLLAAGLAARRLYKYNEATDCLEKFVHLSASENTIDPVKAARIKRELAHTYVASGQYQKAGPLYKDAMRVFNDKLGQDDQEMAMSWFQIGELQETLGEYDKAFSLYKKALAIMENNVGKEHPSLAEMVNKLAALCMELEHEKEAIPLYEQLVKLRENSLRKTHPLLAMAQNNLAESYRLQGMYAEAEECYQKSLKIACHNQGTEHPSVGAIYQELAKLCTSQRKGEEAEQYQNQATAIFDKALREDEKRSKNTSLSLEL